MSDRLISDLSAAGVLLIAGLLLGLFSRRSFEWRWLLAAVALVLLNNLLLSRGYGLVPEFIDGDRNWTGKALALAGTLAIASLTWFSWRRSGLTLSQRAGSLLPAVPIVLLYCSIFVGFAVAFPSDPATGEDVAFQLTMPGLEEEPFYRGVLLLALDQAFRGRVRFLGVDWGWGALLSCLAFGLAHAWGYEGGNFTLDPMYLALTALPSLIAVWVRYRTGSLLLPVAMHNFGNAIGMLIR